MGIYQVQLTHSIKEFMMKQTIEIWICSNSAIDYLNYPKEIKVL